MGLFDKLLKKTEKVVITEEILGAHAAGEAVELSEVSDPTFGEGILGKGMAIKPSKGQLLAPIDGEVSMVFETKHACSLVSPMGAEILLHIGLDTVSLGGKHFTAKVSAGQKVKKGDVLIEFDMDKIKEEGFDTIIPMIICNTDEFSSVEALVGKTVSGGEDVLKISK